MATVPNPEEWLANANDAINISLVAPSKSGLQSIATFNPKFTYSIFGEEEQIFGYKNLTIKILYRANDMRPHLKVAYSRKFKGIGEVGPTDIEGILEEGKHLPKVAFVKASDFEASSKQISDDWVPPGVLHTTINAPEGDYEIWRGCLTEPAVAQLNTRIQFFLPLFIEGGSYIGHDPESDSNEPDLSDADRWTFFFMYRKQKSPENPDKSSYVFVGYATVYRFYYFQPPTPPASPEGEWELPKGDVNLAELPSRARLSQFLILPPFQGTGNGARLYKTMFEHYLKRSQTHEFTVEDPNEAFDDLRDLCDLAYLRTVPEFNELRINTDITLPKSGPVPQLIAGGDKLETIRRQAKIAPRQFHRVLELHLMSQLPDLVRPTMSLNNEVPVPTKADKHQEKLWQMIVKQRLYRHNRDVLSQVELSERIEKLQQTLSSVELDYARLLAAYERAAKNIQSQSAVGTNGKRKMEEDGGEGPSKRARVEDA